MIRDTVLVCCIVICCVLFYRMYILNQKINNLEEKSSVLENFSQSIFQFITQREEARLKQEQESNPTQEPNPNQESNQVKEVVYSNQPSASLAPINEAEAETEDNQYNVTDTKSGEQISESFESKEILSEMVAELKDSLIKTTNENLENDLQQIQELKQELKQELSNQNDVKNEELFDVLNNADVDNKDDDDDDKKKEEELNKMSLADIKSLAKIKNIPLVKSNKPKKKEALIQELLAE